MLLSFSLRTAFCAAVGVFAVAACSSGTNSGFFGADGGEGTTNDGGPSESSTATGDSGSAADAAPASCYDPTCPLALCQCKDKTFYSPTGVCKENGKCAIVTACEGACGAAGFSGGVFEAAVCTGTGTCGITSQPSIECACNQGFGMNTYPRCANGHCSTAPQDTCPQACATQGGWTCKSIEDCAPLVCACKDGKNPVTASPCSGGSCSNATAQCPAACSSHGGWAGTPSTNTPDAGTTGPKAPGAACNLSSECGAFSCTCNNAATFNGNKLCESKQCATKAGTCNFVCSGNGGWSGT